MKLVLRQKTWSLVRKVRHNTWTIDLMPSNRIIKWWRQEGMQNSHLIRASQLSGECSNLNRTTPSLKPISAQYRPNRQKRTWCRFNKTHTWSERRIKATRTELALKLDIAGVKCPIESWLLLTLKDNHQVRRIETWKSHRTLRKYFPRLRCSKRKWTLTMSRTG